MFLRESGIISFEAVCSVCTITFYERACGHIMMNVCCTHSRIGHGDCDE
jgi:hypothetical protein